MHFTFCNNNNYLPARITAREATEQKLLEWPYTMYGISNSKRCQLSSAVSDFCSMCNHDHYSCCVPPPVL